MKFYVACVDPRLLLGLEGRAVTGHLPHLVLVCVAPSPDAVAIVRGLPEHLRDRVVLEPSEQLLASGRISALLSDDPEGTRAAFPGVSAQDIVTWEGMGEAYARWMRTSYLPACQRSVSLPEGLFPHDWSFEAMCLEVVGSCGAAHLHNAVAVVASDLQAEIDSFHTVQNHPSERGSGGSESPTARVVVPPLRYMHPASLDDFVGCEDHERLFAETVSHAREYLRSVRDQNPSVDLYVCGFLEPAASPAGLFFPARSLANVKYFVRRLNDELVAWCEQTPGAFFVDCDDAAAAIGRYRVDEGAVAYYSHRGPFDLEYDDNTDALSQIPTVALRDSFEMLSEAFAQLVVREIVHRIVIRSQRSRVKAVIVDLDNTLWRGVAADGEVGSFNTRPQGLVEALKLVKERGIFLAIASKNDEAFIREHWEDILYRWPEVPLTTRLSLEDFDAVQISFRPKSETVPEILDQLGVLPEHAVFIDDNPLEREQVQAALPRLRILGAELNYVRRELIHSPFTQSDVRTDEDRLRARTVQKRGELARATAAGSGEAFLASLRLSCELATVTDPGSREAARAVQLINKTNQWTLNGARTTDRELAHTLAAGHRLVIAHVRDAHNDYGIVAAALIDPDASRVPAMVVSCRVIGMGIDDAVLAALLADHGPLRLAYSETDRNRAARDAVQRWTDTRPTHDAQVLALEHPTHIHRERGDDGARDELAAGAVPAQR